jgi:hypothetical protein
MEITNKNMKLVTIGLVAAVLACQGCALLTRTQLKGKVPRIDAKVYEASLNTIYGASGTIRETDVKWNGDVKSVGTSHLRVTSPFGGFEEKIEGATFSEKQQPPAKP